jgi:hypothetical protein
VGPAAGCGASDKSAREAGLRLETIAPPCVGPAAGVAAKVAARGDSLLAADFATNGVASGDRTELRLLSLAIAATKVATYGERTELSLAIAVTKVAAWGDRTVLWLDKPELAAVSYFNALGAFILLYVSRMGMDVFGWWNALRFEG